MNSSPITKRENQAQEIAQTEHAGANSQTHRKEMLVLCALLLQETTNTIVKTTNIDEKTLDSQGSSMKSLVAREEALGHFHQVFETDYYTTYYTYKEPSLFHHWGWIKHHRFVRRNQTAAEKSREQQKQVDAERSQIAGSFGQLQTKAQAPMTKLDTDTNSMQMAQQQGLNLIVKLQQLTFAALQRRQV